MVGGAHDQWVGTQPRQDASPSQDTSSLLASSTQSSCFWILGGNWRTWRKPPQALGEHDVQVERSKLELNPEASVGAMELSPVEAGVDVCSC